jgi:hypothetical protein
MAAPGVPAGRAKGVVQVMATARRDAGAAGDDSYKLTKAIKPGETRIDTYLTPFEGGEYRAGCL